MTCTPQYTFPRCPFSYLCRHAQFPRDTVYNGRGVNISEKLVIPGPSSSFHARFPSAKRAQLTMLHFWITFITHPEIFSGK